MPYATSRTPLFLSFKWSGLALSTLAHVDGVGSGGVHFIALGDLGAGFFISPQTTWSMQAGRKLRPLGIPSFFEGEQICSQARIDITSFPLEVGYGVLAAEGHILYFTLVKIQGWVSVA